MSYYLGIDLGGTNIVAGVLDDQYRIIHKESRPTVLKRSLETIVADMADAAKLALKNAGLTDKDIDYVGIGVPSSINPTTKRVVFANNLGWKDADVIGEFHKNWDIPVKMANDADCAALGEAIAGAARNYDNVLMVTLGTGVGGGVVLDKKLFLGGDGLVLSPATAC